MAGSEELKTAEQGEKRQGGGFQMGIEGWLLVLSVLLFLCGLFPALWDGVSQLPGFFWGCLTWIVSSLIWLIDVRNWSRLGWFIATILFLAFLLGIRAWANRDE